MSVEVDYPRGRALGPFSLAVEAGEIAAIGDHATLYGSSPLYRSLYDRQAVSA